MVQYRLQCCKCGKKVGVRGAVFLQRVEKYGSIEKLLTGYLCRDCRPKGPPDGHMQCIICGEFKTVRTDVYKQRIERYGSEEKLLKNYLCRKCRKAVKRIKSKRHGWESVKEALKASAHYGLVSIDKYLESDKDE